MTATSRPIRRRHRTRALAAAALLLAASARAGLFARRPRWTRAEPHFETRGTRRIAVAVGTAKDANPSLARSAAEDGARVGLLRLLQGKSPDAAAEGAVKGARPVEFYEAGGGRVFVRLELDVTPAAAP
jgi:hypothetical protein